MCWCTPGRRTPCCGGLNCHPPASALEIETLKTTSQNYYDTLTRTQAECTRLLEENRKLEALLKTSNIPALCQCCECRAICAECGFNPADV